MSNTITVHSNLYIYIYIIFIIDFNSFIYKLHSLHINTCIFVNITEYSKYLIVIFIYYTCTVIVEFSLLMLKKIDSFVFCMKWMNLAEKRVALFREPRYYLLKLADILVKKSVTSMALLRVTQILSDSALKTNFLLKKILCFKNTNSLL